MDKKNEEAATLKKKKTTINKAKVKKTIKNTLCRPDLVFWPSIAEEQAKLLEDALAKQKVDIPEFNKPHWNALKSIPKDQRPKQPKIKKVEGLIFGITKCAEAIKDKQCSAVIIESLVNPRTIVQPVIESCMSNQVSVVCLNNLKKISLNNFGIPTICLAIKTGFLHELSSKVEEISKEHKLPQAAIEKVSEEVNLIQETVQDKMEVDEKLKKVTQSPTSFTYLYRTSKNMRVFNPSEEEQSKPKRAFIGQDFIEFSDKPEQKPKDSKAYMGMILKRITNNQNRTKRK